MTEQIVYQELLEPVTTLIRIGILEYFPIGTKLSISNHRVYIQKPSLIQATLRWTFGDNRQNLYQLFLAIQLFVNMPYVCDKTDKIQLLEQGARGLTRLKETYRSSTNHNMVIHSLEYYISQIYLMINQLKLTEDESNINSKLNKNHDETTTQLFIQTTEYYQRFKDKLSVDACVPWTQDDFDLILQFFTIFSKKKDKSLQELNVYIEALETIINTKDQCFLQS